MSMHVGMHVFVCVPMHDPKEMNEQFDFLFIQLVKG